jgi:hypothetical protein
MVGLLSKLSLFLSLHVCVAPVELSDGSGRGGGELLGEEQNHTKARKPGPL